MNQEVSGGFKKYLNVLSGNAIKTTFMGTSGRMWFVFSLKSLQNCIIFIPKGPKAWPILGLGLATPAWTRRLILAMFEDVDYLYKL